MGAVAESVLRLVLAGLHSVLWLRHWICVTCEWFWMNLLLHYISTKHKGATLESIAEDAKLLVKVPKHLALLVEERVSCDDLARLVMWAFASGITTVSLYDSHGTNLIYVDKVD